MSEASEQGAEVEPTYNHSLFAEYAMFGASDHREKGRSATTEEAKRHATEQDRRHQAIAETLRNFTAKATTPAEAEQILERRIKDLDLKAKQQPLHAAGFNAEAFTLMDAQNFLAREGNKNLDKVVKFQNWRQRNSKSKQESSPNNQAATLESTSEREANRERWTETALREAGSAVYMAFPAEVRGTAGNGFQTLADNRRLDMKNGQSVSNSSLRNRLGDEYGNLQGSVKLEGSGIHEFITFQPTYKTQQEVVNIPAETRKNWLGREQIVQPARQETRTQYVPALHADVVQGGRAEPAMSITYNVMGDGSQEHAFLVANDGRPGQVVSLEMAFPESVARQLAGALTADPGLIRVIAERVITEKVIGDRKDAWTKQYVNNLGKPNGDTLRPPYERWDALQNGGKIYIDQPAASVGFHPEFVKSVKG